MCIRDRLGRLPLSETEEKAKMLIATDYARKMALDMRMIDPHYDCLLYTSAIFTSVSNSRLM